MKAAIINSKKWYPQGSKRKAEGFKDEFKGSGVSFVVLSHHMHNELSTSEFCFVLFQK